ncbi:MAG: hypothetical protein ABFS41_18325 [Myxococcota bacterium]
MTTTHSAAATARPLEPVRLLVADEDGRIYDHPELTLAGERGAGPERIGAREWLPLPRGSDLFALPGRAPVGLDGRCPVVVDEWLGGEARAVRCADGEEIEAKRAIIADVAAPELRIAGMSAAQRRSD